METLTIERSIWINASRERVWQTITDPEQIEKWFSPGIVWHSTGFHVGGKIYVLDEQTQTEMYTQVIEQIEPLHVLVMRSASPETPYTTTYHLYEENGGTRLVLRHGGYEFESEETRQKNMEQNGVGFEMFMANIKAAVEGTPLPHPMGF